MIAQKIRVERARQGLTQRQLAKCAGLRTSTISLIETGRTSAPRLDTLEAIAKALGMSVWELVA